MHKVNQPTINIGTLGHVSHGKSSIVKALTGQSTIRHSKETKQSGMTIKLGYANVEIWMCEECPKPSCYQTFTAMEKNCKHCDSVCKLKRHVSFVDCPGHNNLMATMINGTAVMDGALLVISSNDVVPQPQTTEHILAAEIMGVNKPFFKKNIFVVQNKIDLIDEKKAQINKQDISNFLKGTLASKSPIIPVSAQLGVNVDVLLQHIVNLPQPIRDLKSTPLLNTIRSFDVNKPGAIDFENMKGSVIGGSLERGILKIGQKIELRPGIVNKQTMTYTPLFSTITSLAFENNPKNILTEVIPGGLVGIGTTIDPSLGKDDGLVGQVLGLEGHLPPVFREFETTFHLIKNKSKLKLKEQILISVGSLTVFGEIVCVKPQRVKMQTLVCANQGQNIALLRKEAGSKGWRLAGWGCIELVI